MGAIIRSISRRPSTVGSPVSAGAFQWAALCAAVVLLPLPMGLALYVAPGLEPGWHTAVVAQPFDVALLVMAGASIVIWGDEARRDARPAPNMMLRIVAGTAVALSATSFALSPSMLGVGLVVRLGLGVIVTYTVLRAIRSGRGPQLIDLVVLVGLAQVGLALAQVATRGSLSIPGIMVPSELYRFGESFAGRGSFTHPYFLASFLSVAVALGVSRALRNDHPVHLVGPAVLCLGLAVTYSRAALVGLVLVAAVVIARSGRDHTGRRAGVVLAVSVLGFLIGVFAFGDGWAARASVSIDATTVDSQRFERWNEASGLIEAHPVAGVGPGRYVVALSETGIDGPLPAHNIVLHVAAEGGVALGALVTVGLLGVAFRALRGSAVSALAFVALVPFLLLDAYPYTIPSGLVLTALWLGFVLAPARNIGPGSHRSSSRATGAGNTSR